MILKNGYNDLKNAEKEVAVKRRFFIVLLLLFLLCPSLSHADMGPKPYVSVHIAGSDTR